MDWLRDAFLFGGVVYVALLLRDVNTNLKAIIYNLRLMRGDRPD